MCRNRRRPPESGTRFVKKVGFSREKCLKAAVFRKKKPALEAIIAQKPRENQRNTTVPVHFSAESGEKSTPKTGPKGRQIAKSIKKKRLFFELLLIFFHY